MCWLIYVWGSAIPVFAYLELRFGRQALQNLAPGVEPNGVNFVRKFAAQVEPQYFNERGRKYRALMIRNEIVYVFWIFVIGPIAIHFS